MRTTVLSSNTASDSILIQNITVKSQMFLLIAPQPLQVMLREATFGHAISDMCPLALETAVQGQSPSLLGTEGSFLSSPFRTLGKTRPVACGGKVRAAGEVVTRLGGWNAQPVAVASSLLSPPCLSLGEGF